MIFKEFSSPRPYFIIDDFFTSEQLKTLWHEFKKMKSQFVVGIGGKYYESRYIETKKNRVKVIENSSSRKKPNHPILETFYNQLWSQEVIQSLDDVDNPIFELLKIYRANGVQISTYGNGDHFLPHRDPSGPSNLTVVVFLCNEPKKFKGGDFVIEHKNSKKIIPFKNNRVLVFGSSTLHSVTPIKLNSKRFEDKRITLQIRPSHRVEGSSADPNGAKAARSKGDVTDTNKPEYKEIPYFGLTQGVWRCVESFFNQVDFREAYAGSDAGDMFEIPCTALSILAGNLKYLSRKYLEGRETTVKTEFLPVSHTDQRVARLSCVVDKSMANLSFGYQMVRGRNGKGKEKTNLQLFVRVKRQGKPPIEEVQRISANLEAKETESIFRALFSKVVKESRRIPGPSLGRNIFQKAA